jgi:hypothetical protein
MRSVAPRPQARAVCAGPVPMRESQISSGDGRVGGLWRSQLAENAMPTPTTKPRSARLPLIQAAAYRNLRARRPALRRRLRRAR